MPTGSLSTAIVFAVLPAAVLLAGIYWLDRYEKEPLRLIALAVAVGALGAPLLAFAVEKAFGLPTSIAVWSTVPHSRLTVGTPLIEELARGVAIFAVFLLVRGEIDDALDGVIYGAVVGIGFALGAAFASILATPSLPGAHAPSLSVVVLAGLNHLFYGALIGLAVALARDGSRAVAAAAALGGTAVAFGFHALHDYLPWWVATPATSATSDHLGALLGNLPNLLGLAGLAVVVVWTLGSEALMVARELRDEVATGVILPAEYLIVTNPLQRAVSLARTLITSGEHRWRVQRRLYAAEVELAFSKYHHRTGTPHGIRLRDDEAYREQIRALRSTRTEGGEGS